jgi:hypothetical protein
MPEQRQLAWSAILSPQVWLHAQLKPDAGLFQWVAFSFCSVVMETSVQSIAKPCYAVGPCWGVLRVHAADHVAESVHELRRFSTLGYLQSPAPSLGENPENGQRRDLICSAPSRSVAAGCTHRAPSRRRQHRG